MRLLRLNEIIRVRPYTIVLCSYKKMKRHQKCVCTEERPCEDIARRWPSANQTRRSHQKPILIHLELEL